MVDAERSFSPFVGRALGDRAAAPLRRRRFAANARRSRALLGVATAVDERGRRHASATEAAPARARIDARSGA